MCYFFGETSSANKCSDTATSLFVTDPTRTLLYIYTPPDVSFKSSDVPIVVTTAGKKEQYYPGLVLYPLVQRYTFHIHTFIRTKTGVSLPNANTNPDILTSIPDEVYFNEFIPLPRLIDGPVDPDVISTVFPNLPAYPTPPNLVINYRTAEANADTFLEFTYTH